MKKQELPLMWTRQDIQEICKCGYTRACKIFTDVYNSIPEEKRIAQHKTTVPYGYILPFLDPSVTKENTKD